MNPTSCEKFKNRQKRVFPSNLIWILNLVFYFGFLIYFYSFTPIFLIGIINSFIYVQSKAFNSRKLIPTTIRRLSIQKVEHQRFDFVFPISIVVISNYQIWKSSIANR